MDLFAGVLPFVHVAEEKSFRKAAARLGVTTAAVSKAVRRLEEDVGARLLERTSRQVALTPEGAEFLERAREAVAQVRAARETVAQAQRAPSGRSPCRCPTSWRRWCCPAWRGSSRATHS
ncbi:LysR family transcriptional regulator [Pyxidicoccus sp. 3LFB2]